MILREIEIKNFMSLEHVTLKGLDRMNLLIGRNNVGKSAVLRAMEHLSKAVNGQPLGTRLDQRPDAVITDNAEELEFRLRVDLDDGERSEFVDLMAGVKTNFNKDAFLRSKFLTWIEFRFRSAKRRAGTIHVVEILTIGRDGNQAKVQSLDPKTPLETTNPISVVVNFDLLVTQNTTFDSSMMTLDSAPSNRYGVNCNIHASRLGGDIGGVGKLTRWIPNRFARFLGDCFFFSPYRRCKERMELSETQRLAQTGENMPQVISTVHSQNRYLFQKIEAFVSAAAPEIGELHYPFRGKEVEVGFNRREGFGFDHIHEMGGGIEQLLMVATLLQTTPKSYPLFLEEPESHLHPEAQRFLRDQLTADGRQVFITSHSPVYLNTTAPQSVYRVQRISRRSNIKQVAKPVEFAQLLDEIGVRNSDVLLSDAVLFVEGPGDQKVLMAFADTLETPLTTNHVTVLTMGGGRYTDRHAPLRSDLLAGIAEKSPVPHLFVIDRDERTEQAVQELHKKPALDNRCHVFARREIENYMLCPRAILEVLQNKSKGSQEAEEKLKGVAEKVIDEKIQAAASGLKGTVLIRRIRWELPGLVQGVLPDKDRNELVQYADDPNLAKRIKQVIERILNDLNSKLDLTSLVEKHRKQLDADWLDQKKQLELAPGEEILKAVFDDFGLVYDKVKDGVRIAKAMKDNEIPEEIKEVIKRAVSLV